MKFNEEVEVKTMEPMPEVLEIDEVRFLFKEYAVFSLINLILLVEYIPLPVINVPRVPLIS